jgi:hypothetical protein
MSAYKKIDCSFKDYTTLIDCLKHLGYDPIVYKEKHNLSGWQNDIREEKAEIIVPKNQISRISNDLGFVYDEEKKEYTMICSDFDSHKGVADKVKQAYALIAIKSALKNHKFSINAETKGKDKTITINAGKII